MIFIVDGSMKMKEFKYQCTITCELQSIFRTIFEEVRCKFEILCIPRSSSTRLDGSWTPVSASQQAMDSGHYRMRKLWLFDPIGAGGAVQ